MGSYVRVDEGRRLSQLCARRRLGHLQLCFSRRYPKPELLAERLPPGAPGCLNVQPLLGGDISQRWLQEHHEVTVFPRVLPCFGLGTAVWGRFVCLSCLVDTSFSSPPFRGSMTQPNGF